MSARTLAGAFRCTLTPKLKLKPCPALADSNSGTRSAKS